MEAPDAVVETALRAAGWRPHPASASAWVRPDGTWFEDRASAYRHLQIEEAYASGGTAAVTSLMSVSLSRESHDV